MKKTLGLLLAIVMVVSVMPAISLAEGDLVTLKVMGYERLLQDTFFTDREEYFVWQKAEEMFAAAGIALEFEIIADSEQYKTTIQTRLAAGHDLPDLVFLGSDSIMKSTDVLDLADMGIILPMNEILEITQGDAYNYFFGGEGDKARQLLTAEDGNFYWLPRIQMNMLNGVFAGTSMGLTIRKDWLDLIGKEVPTTLDELTDALREFQAQDVNGSGAADEMVAIETASFANGLSHLFGMVTSPGTDVVGVNITDGTAESPWYSPVAKEYFLYIQQLIEEGLLYPDAIGAENFANAIKVILNENKVSAQYYYPVGTYSEVEIRTAAEEGTQGKDAEYVGMYPFAANEAIEPFLSEETPYLVYLKHAVTSAAADKLEDVAKLFDVIYSQEYIDLMDWGIEGSMYEEVDGERVNLIRGKSFAELAADRISTVDQLYRNFLPNLYHNERSVEINSTVDWPNKQDYEWAVDGYPNKTPNDNSGYYAMPTAEQTAFLDSHLVDLTTYSKEAATNLSLGRMSVEEDWDTIIETLKSLGLDEVIAIRQDQLDRANGK